MFFFWISIYMLLKPANSGNWTLEKILFERHQNNTAMGWITSLTKKTNKKKQIFIHRNVQLRMIFFTCSLMYTFFFKHYFSLNKSAHLFFFNSVDKVYSSKWEVKKTMFASLTWNIKLEIQFEISSDSELVNIINNYIFYCLYYWFQDNMKS